VGDAEWSLIVGLGNPGSRYQGTRHNVGFMVLDRLAVRQALQWDERHGSLLTIWRFGGRRVVLLKPLSWMNLSGGPVQRALAFYKIPFFNLLVIHDDLDLSVGRLRIRTSGGDGGHRGVRSVIAQLGTKGFARLRFGIGRPDGDAADFVLSTFGRDETIGVDEGLDTAGEAVEVFLRDGVAVAMNRFNRGGHQDA